MSPCESSLEDQQREKQSTGAPALPSWELQLYVLLRRFFLCLYFFFFAGLRRFFLRCFLSRSVEESELSSPLDWELLLLDLLCFCLTVLRIGDIANWFTVTTSEWTFDILVLADDSLQLDEWIWTETGFISRALSCLCFSSNSKNIFLSSSATEGILLLQAIRSVAISFWSANFPPGVPGEYFSGNALSKRCVTAVAKAEMLLDWNASRFFSPCLLFQFHEWLPLVRVSSSLFLQNAHYVSFFVHTWSTKARYTYHSFCYHHFGDHECDSFHKVNCNFQHEAAPQLAIQALEDGFQ